MSSLTGYIMSEYISKCMLQLPRRKVFAMGGAQCSASGMLLSLLVF